MTVTAADPKATIDGRINNLVSSYEQEQEQKRIAAAQAAEEARQQRRRMIEQYFGDLWPVFEPYAAPAEIERDRRYWTQFDVEPLALAPFRFVPYMEHGQLYAKYATDDHQIDAYTREGEIDKMLIHLRGRYEDLQRGAAERAEIEAQEAAEAQHRQAEQAELKAAYTARYLAYRLEYNRIHQHNADLVDAWNKAHAQPYQVKQIAYPVGADEENAGEATAWIATYPNGEWTDAAGYMLTADYYGPARRRRYARLIWEDAPQTYTPGPDCQYQRHAEIAVNFTIYAPPAEQSIQEEAADLYAAMLPYPTWPEPPEGLYTRGAYDARQEIDAKLGDHHRTDYIPY